MDALTKETIQLLAELIDHMVVGGIKVISREGSTIGAGKHRFIFDVEEVEVIGGVDA